MGSCCTGGVDAIPRVDGRYLGSRASASGDWLHQQSTERSPVGAPPAAPPGLVTAFHDQERANNTVVVMHLDKDDHS